MTRVLAPAVELAQEGYPVAPQTALAWQRSAGIQLAQAVNGVEMTIGGRGPNPGEIFRNPGLAQALTLIAFEGKDAYYRGPIARAIVDVIREAGGCMELEDLAAHTSTWEQPISTTYRGLRFWEIPPNGQGIAALMALNILEGFDLAGQDPLSTARLHLLIEAMRLAFADARQFVADHVLQPGAAGRAAQQGLRRRAPQADQPRPGQPGGAPRHRRWAPATRCISAWWTRMATPVRSSTATTWALAPASSRAAGASPCRTAGTISAWTRIIPTALEPRKRPYHTIIPAMITREADDSLFASYGVMGGFMQPQGHMQVAVALADDGADPQSALDRPRFCIEPDEAGSVVSLEEGIPLKVMAELAERGHRVRPVSGAGRALFGRGQVIYRDPESGVLWGGSDPRADGCAMTLV